MTVLLNDRTVENITVLDDETIQFYLPVGIEPGIYDVWVTNSKSQEAVLGSGLKLGKLMYLPIIAR